MQPDLTHRPQYHFLPPAGWLNDPNGLIHWQGKVYHLFYQHNPDEAIHGNIHWGHARSTNLVHWEHLPIALTPTPDSFDKQGCWSGCMVNNNGIPTIFYTGREGGKDGDNEKLLMATGSPDLLTWQKNPYENLAIPPQDKAITGFRDPYIWREQNTWYMLIGSGFVDEGGANSALSLPEFKAWQYLHPLLVGDAKKHYIMWECPFFFPLSKKYVLVVNLWQQNRAHYFIGDYDPATHQFFPESEGILDGGGYYQAPHIFRDAKRRHIALAWIQEGRSIAMQKKANRAGVISLPRQLSLDDKNRLRMEPIPELQVLRGQHQHFENILLTADIPHAFPDIQGEYLEIVAEFEPPHNGTCGLKVRCSPDGEEQTLVTFRTNDGFFSIDREHSSLHPDAEKDLHGITLKRAQGENLRLHIFLDNSVLEVIANQQVALTGRIYPRREDSVQIQAFSTVRDGTLKSMDIWQMPSIWT